MKIEKALIITAETRDEVDAKYLELCADGWERWSDTDLARGGEYQAIAIAPDSSEQTEK